MDNLLFLCIRLSFKGVHVWLVDNSTWMLALCGHELTDNGAYRDQVPDIRRGEEHSHGGRRRGRGGHRGASAQGEASGRGGVGDRREEGEGGRGGEEEEGGRGEEEEGGGREEEERGGGRGEEEEKVLPSASVHAVPSAAVPAAVPVPVPQAVLHPRRGRVPRALHHRLRLLREERHDQPYQLFQQKALEFPASVDHRFGIGFHAHSLSVLLILAWSFSIIQLVD